jgi:hypothetical protein
LRLPPTSKPTDTSDLKPEALIDAVMVARPATEGDNQTAFLFEFENAVKEPLCRTNPPNARPAKG